MSLLSTREIMLSEVLRQTSWGERLGALVLAGLTIWYWPSPWPIIVGLLYVAGEVFGIVRSRLMLLAAIALPPRPMHMRWTLTVWLTERALATLGIEAERQAEFKRFLGTYEGGSKFLFEDEPIPGWVSEPIEISYEAWGESLERWQVSHALKKSPEVLERIPAARDFVIATSWRFGRASRRACATTYASVASSCIRRESCALRIPTQVMSGLTGRW